MHGEKQTNTPIIALRQSWSMTQAEFAHTDGESLGERAPGAQPARAQGDGERGASRRDAARVRDQF